MPTGDGIQDFASSKADRGFVPKSTTSALVGYSAGSPAPAVAKVERGSIEQHDDDDMPDMGTVKTGTIHMTNRRPQEPSYLIEKRGSADVATAEFLQQLGMIDVVASRQEPISKTASAGAGNISETAERIPRQSRELWGRAPGVEKQAGIKDGVKRFVSKNISTVTGDELKAAKNAGSEAIQKVRDAGYKAIDEAHNAGHAAGAAQARAAGAKALKGAKAETAEATRKGKRNTLIAAGIGATTTAGAGAVALRERSKRKKQEKVASIIADLKKEAGGLGDIAKGLSMAGKGALKVPGEAVGATVAAGRKAGAATVAAGRKGVEIAKDLKPVTTGKAREMADSARRAGQQLGREAGAERGLAIGAAEREAARLKHIESMKRVKAQHAHELASTGAAHADELSRTRMEGNAALGKVESQAKSDVAAAQSQTADAKRRGRNLAIGVGATALGAGVIGGRVTKRDHDKAASASFEKEALLKALSGFAKGLRTGISAGADDVAKRVGRIDNAVGAQKDMAAAGLKAADRISTGALKGNKLGLQVGQFVQKRPLTTAGLAIGTGVVGGGLAFGGREKKASVNAASSLASALKKQASAADEAGEALIARARRLADRGRNMLSEGADKVKDVAGKAANKAKDADDVLNVKSPMDSVRAHAGKAIAGTAAVTAAGGYMAGRKKKNEKTAGADLNKEAWRMGAGALAGLGAGAAGGGAIGNATDGPQGAIAGSVGGSVLGGAVGLGAGALLQERADTKHLINMRKVRSPGHGLMSGAAKVIKKVAEPVAGRSEKTAGIRDSVANMNPRLKAALKILAGGGALAGAGAVGHKIGKERYEQQGLVVAPGADGSTDVYSTSGPHVRQLRRLVQAGDTDAARELAARLNSEAGVLQRVS